MPPDAKFDVLIMQRRTFLKWAAVHASKFHSSVSVAKKSIPRETARGALTLSAAELRFVLAPHTGQGWPDILQLSGAMLDNTQLYHQEVS